MIPSRERGGAHRTPHLIVRKARLPGRALPDDGASVGLAMCRPRKAEHYGMLLERVYAPDWGSDQQGMVLLIAVVVC